MCTVQVLDFPLVVSFQQAKNLLLLENVPLQISMMVQKLLAETAPNRQHLHSGHDSLCSWCKRVMEQ